MCVERRRAFVAVDAFGRLCLVHVAGNDGYFNTKLAGLAGLARLASEADVARLAEVPDLSGCEII